MGADGVELDVRLSADGLLVVHHDPVLSDGRNIRELTWTELPPGVALLDPVLDACRGMIVNIEIKNGTRDPDHDPTQRIAELVVATLDRRSLASTAIVSSFGMAAIDRVRELRDEVATAYLSYKSTEALLRSVEHGHRVIHPHRSVVDADYMILAREHHLVVNVWTVDDPDEIVRFAGLGVDGIVTNVPDLALGVLDGSG